MASSEHPAQTSHTNGVTGQCSNVRLWGTELLQRSFQVVNIGVNVFFDGKFGIILNSVVLCNRMRLLSMIAIFSWNWTVTDWILWLKLDVDYLYVEQCTGIGTGIGMVKVLVQVLVLVLVLVLAWYRYWYWYWQCTLHKFDQDYWATCETFILKLDTKSDQDIERINSGQCEMVLIRMVISLQIKLCHPIPLGYIVNVSIWDWLEL